MRAILNEYVSTSLQKGAVVLNSLDMGACCQHCTAPSLQESMAGWSRGLAGGYFTNRAGVCGIAATIQFLSIHPSIYLLFIMRKAALTCVEESSDTCVAYVGQSEYRLIQHVLTTVEVEI